MLKHVTNENSCDQSDGGLFERIHLGLGFDVLTVGLNAKALHRSKHGKLVHDGNLADIVLSDVTNDGSGEHGEDDVFVFHGLERRTIRLVNLPCVPT